MSASADEVTAESWQEVVRRKIAAIRFGSVQITVHDGRVTQVESLEKTRIAPGNNGRGEGGAVRQVKYH